MLGQEIQVKSLRVAQIPVGQAAELVGGYAALSVGIYLAVSGSADGHMLRGFHNRSPERGRGQIRFGA